MSIVNKLVLKLDFENEHVQYEIAMLQQCYLCTEHFDDYFGRKETFKFNVMHEAFCIHAYNLINYFGCDNDMKPFIQMIKDQILTLTIKRTGEYDKKLNTAERNKMYDWIMKHEKFVQDASRDCGKV